MKLAVLVVLGFLAVFTNAAPDGLMRSPVDAVLGTGLDITSQQAEKLKWNNQHPQTPGNLKNILKSSPITKPQASNIAGTLGKAQGGIAGLASGVKDGANKLKKGGGQGGDWSPGQWNGQGIPFPLNIILEAINGQDFNLGAFCNGISNMDLTNFEKYKKSFGFNDFSQFQNKFTSEEVIRATSAIAQQGLASLTEILSKLYAEPQLLGGKSI